MKDNQTIAQFLKVKDFPFEIKDKNGNEMLKLFYQDQEKHAFKFQIMAFVSRLAGLREIVKANPDKNIVIITERSLYTDKEIFAKMLYDQGKMSDVEHQIYLTLFDEFAAEFEVNKVVYIRTDPAKCHERIHVRAREGEELIPLVYLEECHRYHEAFLDQDRGLFKEQLVLLEQRACRESRVQPAHRAQTVQAALYSI